MLLSFSGFSCTTFVIKTLNDLVFGRNLDWVSDNGLIVVNQRGVHKKSLVFIRDEPIEWTSKYGSVTFNQFGKEFPFGGMNEKGLVIEIMLAPADYPNYDNRKAINEIQWIQYHLDNSATIDEVINSRSRIRISPIAQDLHYLICDCSGNVAVIEFRYNKMRVYQDDNLPVPVLENDNYNVSLNNYNVGLKCRFGTAAKMVQQFSSSNNISAVDYSFKILDSVALSQEWSIVYDIKNMQIHFKTFSNQNIKTIDVKNLDYSCNSKTQIYDLQSVSSGNITNMFTNFSHCKNKKKMKDAMHTNEIQVPFYIMSKFFKYHRKCKCEK